jgi:hypothetical protein
MEEHLRDLYLSLLKHCLTGLIYEDTPTLVILAGGIIDRAPRRFIRSLREQGRDHPSYAHTMIGLRRLDNLQQCIETVLADGIPGDLIETGVWRGGATIFMRGVLKAYGVTDRTVWAADSFVGLPAADLERFPEDQGWDKLDLPLAVSLEAVQANFARYQLLDEQVHFLPGWFKDTLPAAPITPLSVLRLDGDLYESTIDALTHLYPKLAPGGFAIVDDYNLPSCRQAVDDYRAAHAISDAIQAIDGWGVFWRRSA